MKTFKSSHFLRKAMALFLTAFLFFQGSGSFSLLAENSGGSSSAVLTNLQFFLTPVGGSETEIPNNADFRRHRQT